MSRRDDDRYVDEMTDAAAERLLAGRTVPEHPELSGIVGALRAEANGPAPAPSAALAALLRDGFTPPAAAPAATPSRPGLLRRVTGLRLLAKSTVAASAAVFVVAGAGAAGALPGATQEVFADVVNAVTPFRVGATEAEVDTDTDTDADPAPAGTPAPDDDAAGQPADDERAEPAPETAAPGDAETPAPSPEPTEDAEPDDVDASEEPVTDESDEYEDPDDAEWDEEPADDEEYEEEPAEEGDPEEEEPADEEEPDDDPAGGLLRLEY